MRGFPWNWVTSGGFNKQEQEWNFDDIDSRLGTIHECQTDIQTPANGWYRALRIASRGKKNLIHSWRPSAVALLEVEFHAAITMHGKPIRLTLDTPQFGHRTPIDVRRRDSPSSPSKLTVTKRSLSSHGLQWALFLLIQLGSTQRCKLSQRRAERRPPTHLTA